MLRKGAALAPEGRAWRASRTRSGSAAGRAVEVARKAAKARREAWGSMVVVELKLSGVW